MFFCTESRRSKASTALHVRQKIIWCALEDGGLETMADVVRAIEPASPTVTYRQFFVALRKTLHLTAAAVTDDAVRTTFKTLDTFGDGAISRDEFLSFIIGRDHGRSLASCLDAAARATLTQRELRRTERVNVLGRRVRRAVDRSGAGVDAYFRDDHFDGLWSCHELTDVLRHRLGLNARACSHDDVLLLLREVSRPRRRRLCSPPPSSPPGPVTVVPAADLRAFLFDDTTTAY